MFAFSAGACHHLGLFGDSDRIARRAIEFGETHNLLLAQAVGYEFMGENATSTGAWTEALSYAESERAIAGRLHSRERVTWTHLYAGLSLLLLGELRRGEDELAAGLAMAEEIGERRVAMLLQAYLATAQAMLGRLDEAEATALAVLARAEAS